MRQKIANDLIDLALLYGQPVDPWSPAVQRVVAARGGGAETPLIPGFDLTAEDLGVEPAYYSSDVGGRLENKGNYRTGKRLWSLLGKLGAVSDQNPTSGGPDGYGFPTRPYSESSLQNERDNQTGAALAWESQERFFNEPSGEPEPGITSATKAPWGGESKNKVALALNAAGLSEAHLRGPGQPEITRSVMRTTLPIKGTTDSGDDDLEREAGDQFFSNTHQTNPMTPEVEGMMHSGQAKRGALSAVNPAAGFGGGNEQSTYVERDREGGYPPLNRRVEEERARLSAKNERRQREEEETRADRTGGIWREHEGFVPRGDSGVSVDTVANPGPWP